MTTTDPLPAGPADITAAWLSAALGMTVTDVEVAPLGTGQTGATYRIRPSYAGPAGPPTLVVKLPSQQDEVRDRVALGYRAEHAFYAGAADTLAVPTPHAYLCEIDRDGADFVLLMDDQAPAEQGDQIRGCTVEEAALAVTALAGLHGPRWCDPAWLDFPGVTMPRADADFAAGVGMAAQLAAATTVERLGGRMSAADRATLLATADATGTWLQLEPDRFALLHGDYRLDNLLFDPARSRITVVDWQTIAVGLPARDLAYFLGTGLTVADRAAAERDLVQRYHAALLTYGVSDYGAETCWRDYRLGTPQITLISSFGVAFAASTERGDDMMLAMLARGCAAIRELGTLELIAELA